MACLTKEQIYAAPDRRTEKVEVPEWGGYVNVLGISASDKDVFDAFRVREMESKSPTRFRNTRAMLAAMSIVDDDGKALFAPADVAKLGEKSGEALDRVYLAAMRVSGMDAGSVDEAKKNSPNETTLDSPTD